MERGDDGRRSPAGWQATGIVALDIEPVILGRDHDPGDAVVDTAAELGVRHVLVASGPAERAAVVQRFGELCERARPAASSSCSSSSRSSRSRTLADAVGVVEEVGQPNGAVLVDTLHLARSGDGPTTFAGVPGAPAAVPAARRRAGRPAGRGRDALRDEALHGRLLPGDGELPLGDVLAAVPGVPLSVELRSAALMERWPDAVERAREVSRAATGRCSTLVAVGVRLGPAPSLRRQWVQVPEVRRGSEWRPRRRAAG